MKNCSTCKELKLFSDFSRCSKSKSGYQSVCKSCKVISVKKSPSALNKKYKYRKKSKEYMLAYYHKTKIARNISRRIRQSLNGERKSDSWSKLVNYNLDDLRKHLESLFQEGMTWDNYGEWHIDHIIPISSFNITSDSCEDFKKCWELSNLQPLWAIDNLKKSNKRSHLDKKSDDSSKDEL